MLNGEKECGLQQELVAQVIGHVGFVQLMADLLLQCETPEADARALRGGVRNSVWEWKRGEPGGSSRSFRCRVSQSSPVVVMWGVTGAAV